MTELLDFEATSKWLEGPLRLHYHEAGAGPVLIMLHGSGPGVSGWSNFRGNFPVFAEHFRTIVMDMPGFGLSERPVFDKVYPKVAADVVADFAQRLKIERAHFLGNSMGGYVAAELALAHPDLVDRMVLMGPGGLSVQTFTPMPPEGYKRLSEFLDHPSREGMAAWVDCMVANRSVISEELIDERMANAMRPGAIESNKAVFATFAQFPDDTPPWMIAQKITHPVLVTWGRDDRMVMFEAGLFPYRQLQNAELHVFPNCGHWAQVERKPEFERLVIEFLSRESD